MFRILYLSLILTILFGCTPSTSSSGGAQSGDFRFSGVQEATSIVDEIMQVAGLPQNFKVEEGDVPNAEARFDSQTRTRYIIYNQKFIDQFKQDTNTDWSAIFVLAHEIGHHLSFHTDLGEGSTPKTELEADEFAGLTLARMNATLSETLAAVVGLPERGSSSHPPRREREAAVRKGWEKAGVPPIPPPTPISALNRLTSLMCRSIAVGGTDYEDEAFQIYSIGDDSYAPLWLSGYSEEPIFNNTLEAGEWLRGLGLHVINDQEIGSIAGVQALRRDAILVDEIPTTLNYHWVLEVNTEELPIHEIDVYGVGTPVSRAQELSQVLCGG